MDTSQDFDLLISKYSDDLIRMKEKWSKWGIVTQEEKTYSPSTKEIEIISESTQETEEDTSEEIMQSETQETEPDIQETETKPQESAPEPKPVSDYPVANPENYANFKAKVFSGEQAYPIEKAKVMLYCQGRLHTFLITGENGETATVKIESANAENALIPNSDNQELDYMADVFADGFTPKKGLLVSAVGNSDIILNVQLTPVPERID